MLKKMNLFDKKHNLSLFFLVFCFLSSSCADEELFKQNETKCGITINVRDFKNENNGTRSLLVPGENGTSFEWEKNDVVAVYSAAKGMTNFFIDETSISDDKTTANFYGSGFSLSLYRSTVAKTMANPHTILKGPQTRLLLLIQTPAVIRQKMVSTKSPRIQAMKNSQNSL